MINHCKTPHFVKLINEVLDRTTSYGQGEYSSSTTMIILLYDNIIYIYIYIYISIIQIKDYIIHWLWPLTFTIQRPQIIFNNPMIKIGSSPNTSTWAYSKYWHN